MSSAFLINYGPFSEGSSLLPVVDRLLICAPVVWRPVVEWLQTGNCVLHRLNKHSTVKGT